MNYYFTVILEEYDRFHGTMKYEVKEKEYKETSRLENLAANEGGCVTCKNCGYSKCD